MKILTIIPVLNASAYLPTLIRALQKQKLSTDILIMDSSSDDDSVKIAKDLGCEVVEIERSEFNHATTRNIALKYEADFYLFVTQDAVPVDEYLVQSLHEAFADTKVVAAYARQLPKKDADAIEKFARETNYPSSSTIKSKESLKEMGIKTFFCSNSCAMYRGEYFRQVGGFTEGLIMNEDMEYAGRAILADKKVAYVAEARVWHSHNFGMADVFKRYFDIGIFFRTNSWISDEINKYSSTQSTGIKQAKKEIGYLFRKKPYLIPKSILFSLTKFVAFKLGYAYERLPHYFVKLFSLHRFYHKI